MNLSRLSYLFPRGSLNVQPVCGMKHFSPPPNYDHIEIPAEKQKLPIVDRQPQYPHMMKAPKMQKRLRYMRGPEEVHNFLIHKQYGLQATCGGRLKWKHMDIIRLLVGRFMDTNRMFAVWRVDPPWQPITKKSQGMRMGGGKGAIDHYVTPVKAGRIIFELAGKMPYGEVKPFLTGLATMMPFDAIPVCYDEMQLAKEKEDRLEKSNLNPYTWKYLIQNDMGGVRRHIKPIDLIHFRKYV